MLNVIRSMRGLDGGEGTFEVFDENGTRMGIMEFIPESDLSVVAKSPWGSLGVRQVMEGRVGRIAVDLDKRPLASLTFAKMFMRMNVKMATGQEIPFKMTLFTDVLYHRSDLGDFRYKSKIPSMYSPPKCSISIKGTGMVDSEDLALVFLASYGFTCHIARHAVEIIRNNR